MLNKLLADAILLLHFAIVLYITLGLPAIWLGAACGWQWVRRFWFRLTHLAAIVFVALEALSGVWCPLTVWEDALRGSTNELSFVARWVHRLMFYQLPEWVFTLAYVSFAAVVGLTWVLVPPRLKR
ncbi:MAG: DUF2784 domain-containing protein [Hylemonella sp.]|jgi:hypothetical protein